MTIAENYGLKASESTWRDIFVCGTECEIESVKDYGNIPGFWNPTQDGSLRNNGMEFISPPLSKDESINAFKQLHAKIRLGSRDEAFSSRTSTHVHVNCLKLKENQVKNLLLLYALFENFFFDCVNPIRKTNIHCVPLNETLLPNIYKNPVDALARQWHKYTALNLIPLRKQGTVEFRHLEGTDNPVLYEQWLTVLENLWLLAKQEPINAHTIVSSDNHFAWYQKIFTGTHVGRLNRNVVNELIKNSLLDVKLAFVN